MMPRRAASGAWSAGAVGLVLWLGLALSWHITRPWTGHHDWNGAVWSQSAHNNLRAGLATTWGIPTGFYSGPLPIPPAGYYVHHPPGLPLTVTAMFALFGEREWAARLVPIASSLVSAVLLWLLVATCVGRRAATLSLAVFSLLPMDLYFGRMVNHEAPALMWMLGALLSLERWRGGRGAGALPQAEGGTGTRFAGARRPGGLPIGALPLWRPLGGRHPDGVGEPSPPHPLGTGGARGTTRRTAWLVVFLGCVVLGMWTAWAVYFFVLVLAVMLLLPLGRLLDKGLKPLACRCGGGERALALGLLALGALSGVLYLLYIGAARPDAWSDARQAVAFRLQGTSASGVPFTWGEWLRRQQEYLGTLIPLVAWGLAVVGAVYVGLRVHLPRAGCPVGGQPRPDQTGRGTRQRLRTLGWSALVLAFTAAIPVLGFRNASYIHDYTGFYFIAPVAMLGGLALEALLRRAGDRDAPALLRGACVGGAVAALVLLGVRGYEGTKALHRVQWWVLDGKVEEPADLIPALGETIYWTFPDETVLLTNLAPRGPHLGYYARRTFLYGYTGYAEWQPVLSQAGDHGGGVVWLGAPGGEELWAQLPAGRRTVVEFGGVRFGFWRPGPGGV